MRNPISSGLFRNTPYWLNFVFTGQAYAAWATKTVAAGGTSFLLVRAPALGPSGRLAHVLQTSHSYFGGGPLQIDTFEDVTVNTAGTVFPLDPVGTGSAIGVSDWDRRFQANKPPTITLENNPVVTLTNAKHIKRFMIPASGPNSSAAGSAFSLERVLNPNSIYAIRFTNLGGQSIDNLFTEIVWYESGN